MSDYLPAACFCSTVPKEMSYLFLDRPGGNQNLRSLSDGRSSFFPTTVFQGLFSFPWVLLAVFPPAVRLDRADEFQDCPLQREVR